MAVEIKHQQDHYAVFCNGKFVSSADTYEEAEEDAEEEKRIREENKQWQQQLES